jgi:signal transduction histidine kinase
LGILTKGERLKLRLRTKFLLSMLLVSAGLTAMSLLLVRRSVQAQVRRGILGDLENSVSTFKSFQREREQTLSHSADLLADLPILRALMTTQHEATIQDGSADLWRLGGSDLFVLADPSGRVVALHVDSPEFTREMAQKSLDSSLAESGSVHWWFGAQHLYQVFLKPIYFGPAAANRQLGFLIIGYEIDDRVAARVGRVAASQVAFYYGNTIVRTTLTPAQEAELGHLQIAGNSSGQPYPLQLGDEHFLSSSVELAGPAASSVRLTVLKSYDQAIGFLDGLNRLLLGLGLAAVIGGCMLVFLISHTFTRPLRSLVSGVRALERGDFHYALDARGGDEVAELTGAFDRMRKSLLKTQQELIEAERLATIGRMASSISHDLRHSLAAIVANAEFLCEGRLSGEQREELYQEVRSAVNQMTDLIDSLLEFSRTRESLRPSFGNVKNSVERVIQAMRAHPGFQHVAISLSQHGISAGWFDQKKLERALFNLLLNACEAVSPDGGEVHLQLHEVSGGVEVRVADNGRGIPEAVRGRIFEPFVSHGKENGTGLGLTVVQKIVQDHGGDVTVEATSERGTVFRLLLPLRPAENSVNGEYDKSAASSRREQAQTD